MRAPEEKEFKGWPVIEVFTGESYNNKPASVMLGVKKAAAVVDNIDYIRTFVDKHKSNSRR